MSSNVCADQATYDAAFQHAVNSYQNRPQTRTMAIVSVIMLFFSIWAILLAMKVKDKEQRVIHFIFAIALGPIYVLCYYSSMLVKDDSMSGLSL